MKDRILDKFIKFDVLLGVVALVIALVAAFFSVYGIATLFAGAFISTAIMASTLEIGKLVAVTYLYRYWKHTKAWLSAYLTFALIILMLITSGGIFGYLSAAYQKSSTAYKAQQDQIVQVEKMKVYAQDKIDQAQNRIKMLAEMRRAQEGRMSEALTNTFVSRNAITLRQLQDQTADMIRQNEADTKAEQLKIETGIKEMGDIDQKVSSMKFADNNKDIRTFEFVAKLFGTTLDNVAKWFIFLLIVVFDPLAIALILAYNVVIYKNLVEPTAISESQPEAPVEEVKKKVPRNQKTGFIFQKIPKIVESETPDAGSEAPPAPKPWESDPFFKGYFKTY